MDREDLARRLRATFATEVEEQAQRWSADVLALEREPADAARLMTVFRAVHTLKGAARAAGVSPIEQVCHVLEDVLVAARQGRHALGEADFAHLLAAADGLRAAVPVLRAGGDLAASPLAALLQEIRGGERHATAPARDAPAATSTPATPVPAPDAERAPPASTPPPAALPAPAATPPRPQAAPSPPPPASPVQVRLDVARLDELLAASGELLVARARVEHANLEVAALADEIATTVERVRRALPARRAARARTPARATSGADDVDEQLHRLARRATRLAAAATRESRLLATVVTQMARQTEELRMRPFGEAVEPLERVVRDLTRATGKEVVLAASGTTVHADRAVLEGLRDALVQLVRNAVDHGIEPADERRRLGKPVPATVTVSAALAGDRIVVRVQDDGAGVDAERLRAVLAARGRAAPADEEELAAALLAGSISTREEAGLISGRGVGLDVVREAVQRIQGSITVRWERQRGTTFTIECAPSLATTRIVLVAVGPHLLALPTADVLRLMRLRPDAIRLAEGRQLVLMDEGPVPLVGLAQVLGPPLVARPVADAIPVVVLARGGRRLAIAVDELRAEQRVAVRQLPPEAAHTRFASGATVLGNGRVVPILAVDRLLEEGAGGVAAIALPAIETGKRRRLLVVDDSITTRTLEESLLEAAGYDVLTAVDGADAWRLLQENTCDLVVADVDMPRMDGFDLCRALRASKRHRELPVVLVTALETPEDRRRGMEVGADAYLGKSTFDQEQLLDTIRRMLP